MSSNADQPSVVTFVTGNEKKALHFSRVTAINVAYRNVSVDEIQSLDLTPIVIDKARRAFEEVQSPVIVEDVALEMAALGGLPGPLVKWFLERMDLEEMCALPGERSRRAVARCQVVFFDGHLERVFEGHLDGEIARKPSGDAGFGWDAIFIPQGYDSTRAELSDADYDTTYLQLKPFHQVAEFLHSQGYKG